MEACGDYGAGFSPALKVELWPRGVFSLCLFAITWRKDVASNCLLLSFMPQLQSPEEPELFLCYRDGSQHGFCQPPVADLGGEPRGSSQRGEWEGQITLKGDGPTTSLCLRCAN